MRGRTKYPYLQKWALVGCCVLFVVGAKLMPSHPLWDSAINLGYLIMGVLIGVPATPRVAREMEDEDGS